MNAIVWCFVLMSVLSMSQGQISQSIMTIEQIGTDFIPANSTELIMIYTGLPTSTACYYRCHFHPKCRTMVGDMIRPFTCRLYESSIDTGTVVFAASSTSRVAVIHQNHTYFPRYNQSCDSEPICLNNISMTHTSISSTTTTTREYDNIYDSCKDSKLLRDNFWN